MSNTWSFYSLTTGEILPARVQFPSEADLIANTPPGHGRIRGVFDRRRQCIDLATGLPVDREPPPLTADELRALSRTMRDERERRMVACDWVVTKALEAGESVPPQWRAYRQALRQIPAQAGFPEVINWPVAPDE